MKASIMNDCKLSKYYANKRGEEREENGSSAYRRLKPTVIDGQ